MLPLVYLFRMTGQGIQKIIREAGGDPKISAGVYQIRNTVNDKKYVGGAVNLRRRIHLHLYQLKRGIHHSQKLQRAWLKYGADAFVFEVLELVDNIVDVVAREQVALDRERSYERDVGYNICRKGRSRLGVKASAETRAKMSAALKGRKMPPEAVEAMRQRQLGSKHTPETKAKIAASSRGRRHTEKTKKKIGDAHRGKEISEEARARMSAAHKGNPNGWDGRKHTEEAKANMSRVQQDRVTPESREVSRRVMSKRWEEDDGTLRSRISEAVRKAHTGKIVPEEVREKMRAGMRAAWVRRKNKDA